MPFKEGKYRLGATIFGQTGIHADSRTSATRFHEAQNTPIEWNVEGRMKFGPTDHWWAGSAVGTLDRPRLRRAGFAPRSTSFGVYSLRSRIRRGADGRKERRDAMRERWRSEQAAKTRDGDGIPDDIDACPMEEGSKDNDGCPLADRDGDGIPDMYDKCPDQPEDKDGVDDGDGCPETDADNDGIPDTEDACPKQPGQPNPDPKKNGCPTTYTFEGSVIKCVQQVHFATGSATILPDSFPMLQDVVNLLKANANMKRIAVEGHTDNTGAADMNRHLSQLRAESVMQWLVAHGIAASRGSRRTATDTDKPIDTNDTPAGRTKNRRVEFKILEQSDSNQAQKK